MKLAETFVKDMNLVGQPAEIQLLACECLYAVLSAPGNGYMNLECAKEESTLPILKDATSSVLRLVKKVFDIAEYWSNDIMYILVDHLKDYQVETPLISGYDAIFQWLEGREL